LQLENFSVDIDSDGIALLTFDVPHRSMNTITNKVLDELPLLTAFLRENDLVKGAVLCSGKPNGFCAGADVGDMADGTPDSGAEDSELARRQFEALHGISRLFRDFETNGKPVAAAIEGLALGGGLEWLLDCHHRVIADLPKIQIGLPESKLGLLPGGGGTQRLPRLIGIEAALSLILEGRFVGPHEAKALGIVHEVAAPGEVIAAAKAWVKSNGDPLQPWDRPGFEIPGGDGDAPLRRAELAVGEKYHGNYPAYRNIISCIAEGTRVSFDEALRIESGYMQQTMNAPQAKAMMRSLFLSQQELSKGPGRPSTVKKAGFTKVSIIGATPLCAALGFAQAVAGLQTVIVAAGDEHGLGPMRTLLDDVVRQSRMAADKTMQILDRITVTNSLARTAGSELILVSSGQNPSAWGGAGPDCVSVALLESNTARLPASHLIGLHFSDETGKASPVEIVTGAGTSDEALAVAIDYILKLRKLPILVTDSPQFYARRVMAAYADEGRRMLAEGIAGTAIEEAASLISMNDGPAAIGTRMGSEYAETKPAAPTDGHGIDDLRSRLLYRQCIEAARCVDEGVITDSRMADVSAILWWGFASWTGGPLSYIDMVGLDAFLACSEALALKYGNRFAAPLLLQRMYKDGSRFY
jgi:3-hydroxyacyl-CoA dehydrogenase/enoyl-CoA hydratase/3-hydroxybutyryl-CoA epimerase